MFEPLAMKSMRKRQTKKQTNKQKIIITTYIGFRGAYIASKNILYIKRM